MDIALEMQTEIKFFSTYNNATILDVHAWFKLFFVQFGKS